MNFWKFSPLRNYKSNRFTSLYVDWNQCYESVTIRPFKSAKKENKENTQTLECCSYIGWSFHMHARVPIYWKRSWLKLSSLHWISKKKNSKFDSVFFFSSDVDRNIKTRTQNWYRFQVISMQNSHEWEINLSSKKATEKFIIIQLETSMNKRNVFYDGDMSIIRLWSYHLDNQLISKSTFRSSMEKHVLPFNSMNMYLCKSHIDHYLTNAIPKYYFGMYRSDCIFYGNIKLSNDCNQKCW